MHPNKPNSPLINYQLALISLPGIIYGAMIGYILNKFIWEIFLIIGLLYKLISAFLTIYK